MVLSAGRLFCSLCLLLSCFVTSSYSCNGGAGYTLEGIQGYVYVLANQAPGTVPLYRYGNTTNGSHLYTTNFSELGNGGNGYVLEGVQCYVFPTQASGTVPLYRYLNTINGDHFYTTSFSELGNGAFGYVFEGIQCYVYPGPQGVNDSLIYSYGSGNNGNVLGVVINRSGKLFNQLYKYDELNRVISAQELSGSAINWTQTFKYDQYGNQSCCAPSPGPGTQPGQNIATIDPITNRIMDNGYGYDGAGNLTKLPNGTIYSYDGENRMKSATIGGTSASFIYDGNGERVKKSGGITSRYIYSQGRLIAEYTGNAVPKTPSKEYIYGPAGLLAIIDYSTAPATTKYITPDALGSTRIVTGNNGNLISRHDWFAFGAEIDNSLGGRAAITGYGSADNVNQKFTGYERDQETGLDFAQARYYANTMGKFNSPDPVGGSILNPQNWNRYPYVRNNPLKLTDPFGLSPEDPKTPTIDVGQIDVVVVKANKKKKVPISSSIFAGVILGLSGPYGLVGKISGVDLREDAFLRRVQQANPIIGIGSEILTGIAEGGLVSIFTTRAQQLTSIALAAESGVSAGGSSGIPLVLNLGGEGEVEGAINLNALDKGGFLTRSIETIKASGPIIQGDITKGFPVLDASIDQVVGNRLPYFTGEALTNIAEESFKVLKPGGIIRLARSSGNPQGIAEALTNAGFINVRIVGAYAIGVK